MFEKTLQSDDSVNGLTAVGVEPRSSALSVMPRPCVHGKFLFVGDEKLYLRGVTYGTFQPNGESEHDSETVKRDFKLNLCR